MRQPLQVLHVNWVNINNFLKFTPFALVVVGHLTARRPWAQFPGEEGLSVWSLCVLLVSVWVPSRWFHFPHAQKHIPQVEVGILLPSQSPQPKALMRIWISSQRAAQQLASSPQMRMGQMQSTNWTVHQVNVTN